jgi:hypothetical protein
MRNPMAEPQAHIRQLRSGLPLCCLHGRSRRCRTGLIFVTADGETKVENPHNSHSSEPARRTVGASELRMTHATIVVMEHCALRNEPCSGKRQRAITNLRATATIKTRQTRPLCPVDRRANHREIPLLGWCLSQSQAAWIMVPRTSPLPARDIPGDRSTTRSRVAKKLRCSQTFSTPLREKPPG